MLKEIHLTIDSRMSSSSGIGTYIQNILFAIPFKKKLIINDKKEDTENVQFCRVPFSSIYTISEQLLLPFYIRNTDIFWSPHYNIPLLPLRSKKRVVTIHDVFHLAYRKDLSLLQRIYSKVMINAAVRLSNIVFTVSNFSKNEIIKYTGCESQKIYVVYNGVSPDYNSGYDFKQINQDYILYVGNIKPHKNLKNAIKAFQLIIEKFPTYKFYIVGKKDGFITEGLTEINSIIEELGEKLFFTGWVKEEELKNYYANAKLFIFPSLYEGFGIPPLEAMACGCPTLVSNAACIPEICGNASIYFNPKDSLEIADKITILLLDEKLRKEVIGKGFDRVKLFNWQQSIEKTTTVLEKLMG